MNAEQWQTESAEAFRAADDHREVPLGLCAVCHTPVLRAHDPVAVELIQTGHGRLEQGWIHGNFECLDVDRCPEVTHGHGAGGLEATSQCVLPQDHTGSCFWGTPS